jgi:hypothetical protein
MAQEEKKEEIKLPHIRTLKTDAAQYAARAKTSFISLAASELERRRKRLSAERPGGTKYYLWAWLLSLFFLLGAGIGIFFYSTGRAPEVPPPPPKVKSLIIADEETTITLTSKNRDEFGQKIQEELERGLKEGGIRVILLDSLKLEDFLKISGFKMPRRLEINLEDFTLGSLRQGGNDYPFLIFKIRSFEDSFAGILVWEKTMIGELRIIFENLPPWEEALAIFQDKVVKNQDARVLEYEGKTLLVYNFFNKNLLILTTAERALETIISRYTIFPPR